MKKYIFAILLCASSALAQAPSFIDLKYVAATTQNHVVLLASAVKLTDPNSEIYLESSFSGSDLKIRKFTELEAAALSPELIAQQSYNWQVKAYLQDRTRAYQLNLSILEMEREIIDLTKMLDRESDQAKRTHLENAILEAEQRKLTYKTQIENSRKLVETKTLEVIGPMAQPKRANLLSPFQVTYDRTYYVEGHSAKADILFIPGNVENQENLLLDIEAKFDGSPIALDVTGVNSYQTSMTANQLTLGWHYLTMSLFSRDKKDAEALQEVLSRAYVFKIDMQTKALNSTGTEQAYYLKERSEIEIIENVFLDFYAMMRQEVVSTSYYMSVDTDYAMFSKIAVTDGSTCGLREGGLYCWGGNYSGELGLGHTSAVPKPTGNTFFSSGVTDIAAGGNHMCAIRSEALYCWGLNVLGQLGNYTNINSSVPVPVAGMGSGVTKVTAGASHTCAVKSGVIYCWGNNASGGLGAGTGHANSPRTVSTLSGTVLDISAGGNSTCAVVTVSSVSRVYCWGDNSSGQLGINSVVNQATPVVVPSIASLAQKVSVGATSACAIVSGAARCWGNNANGKLGNGTATNSNVPVNVTGFTSGVTKISVASTFACGIKNFELFCWGAGANGALGTGNTTARNVPTAQGSQYATDIDLGVSFGCMVAYYGGNAKCWGRNWGANLGDNFTTVDALSPLDVIKPIPMFVENHKVQY